jgi:hypothetical protein
MKSIFKMILFSVIVVDNLDNFMNMR